jgi:hypothetical protein
VAADERSFSRSLLSGSELGLADNDFRSMAFVCCLQVLSSHSSQSAVVTELLLTPSVVSVSDLRPQSERGMVPLDPSPGHCGGRDIASNLDLK